MHKKEELKEIYNLLNTKYKVLLHRSTEEYLLPHEVEPLCDELEKICIELDYPDDFYNLLEEAIQLYKDCYEN